MAVHPLSMLSCNLGEATGWSSTTVFYDFFLTNIKKQQNGKTQSFSWSWYIDILIFWYLRMVRSNRSCISDLYQYIVIARSQLICIRIEHSDTPRNMPLQWLVLSGGVLCCLELPGGIRGMSRVFWDAFLGALGRLRCLGVLWRWSERSILVQTSRDRAITMYW